MGRESAAAVVTAADVQDLVELSRLLVSVAYRSLDSSPAAVTLPQFRALAVLARSGGCTAGTLAERLDQPPSTVTRLCDKLVAAGWVTRQNRPDNRREVEIELSDSGRDVVTQVMASRAGELDDILSRLPDRSRAALGELLPELLRAADTSAARPHHAWAV